eukprot:SAG31_NODE_16770_length_697_cov_0.827759_2_plen_59_part_01
MSSIAIAFLSPYLHGKRGRVRRLFWPRRVLSGALIQMAISPLSSREDARFLELFFGGIF